jgi:osomolarity two-component system, response regulator SSK1
MEWGCMQALIDYDGWRKWKEFSEIVEEANKKTAVSKVKVKKNKMSLGSIGTGAENDIDE